MKIRIPHVEACLDEGEAIFVEAPVVMTISPGDEIVDVVHVSEFPDPDSNHRFTVYTLANGESVVTG